MRLQFEIRFPCEIIEITLMTVMLGAFLLFSIQCTVWYVSGWMDMRPWTNEANDDDEDNQQDYDRLIGFSLSLPQFQSA